jgi:hypothetical protein
MEKIDKWENKKTRWEIWEYWGWFWEFGKRLEGKEKAKQEKQTPLSIPASEGRTNPASERPANSARGRPANSVSERPANHAIRRTKMNEELARTLDYKILNKFENEN